LNSKPPSWFLHQHAARRTAATAVSVLLKPNALVVHNQLSAATARKPALKILFLVHAAHAVLAQLANATVTVPTVRTAPRVVPSAHAALVLPALAPVKKPLMVDCFQPRPISLPKSRTDGFMIYRRPIGLNSNE